MSGNVYVSDQKEDKAGSMFEEEGTVFRVRGNTLPFVSKRRTEIR